MYFRLQWKQLPAARNVFPAARNELPAARNVQEVFSVLAGNTFRVAGSVLSTSYHRHFIFQLCTQKDGPYKGNEARGREKY